MGPLALAGAVGAVLVVVAAVLVLVRRLRNRRSRDAARLEESRAEVAALSRRVEELSAEVHRTGQLAAADHEYVITSLTDSAAEPAGAARLLGERRRAPLGRVLENRLLTTLAHRRAASPLGDRAVDLVVRTVALGHGVRRALTADNLDRAAAEAHVARRRSRRIRRRELKEARRLLRVVQPHSHDEDVA